MLKSEKDKSGYCIPNRDVKLLEGFVPTSQLNWGLGKWSNLLNFIMTESIRAMIAAIVTNLTIGSTGSKLTHFVWGFPKQINLFHLLHMNKGSWFRDKSKVTGSAMSVTGFGTCQLQPVFLDHKLEDVLNSIATQSSPRTSTIRMSTLLSKDLWCMCNFSITHHASF